MPIRYEVTRFQFEHDPRLEALVREHAANGTSSIQEIIDACTDFGFDGRATATEIGLMLMDKVLRPRVPTTRICGATIVEFGEGAASSRPGNH